MDKQPNSKPEQEKPQPEQPKKKNIRRRGASKTLISEDSKEVVMSIAHQSHKGEKISNTIRRDRKFNPKQRVTDLNGRLL